MTKYTHFYKRVGAIKTGGEIEHYIAACGSPINARGESVQFGNLEGKWVEPDTLFWARKCSRCEKWAKREVKAALGTLVKHGWVLEAEIE